MKVERGEMTLERSDGGQEPYIREKEGQLRKFPNGEAIATELFKGTEFDGKLQAPQLPPRLFTMISHDAEGNMLVPVGVMTRAREVTTEWGQVALGVETKIGSDSLLEQYVPVGLVQDQVAEDFVARLGLLFTSE